MYTLYQTYTPLLLRFFPQLLLLAFLAPLREPRFGPFLAQGVAQSHVEGLSVLQQPVLEGIALDGRFREGSGWVLTAVTISRGTKASSAATS